MPQLDQKDRSTDSGRDRIIDSAADLFLRNGYSETSVRDIARASGIKAASLYYHFDSKDVLLAEVLCLGVNATSEAFDSSSVISDQNASGQDRLRAAIEAHLSALFEHGPYTSAAVMVFPVAPDEVKELVIPTRDAYEQRWTNLLIELVEMGEMAADTDVTLTRLFLLGTLNSTVEWFDVTGSLSVPELAISLGEIFWNGRSA